MPMLSVACSRSGAVKVNATDGRVVSVIGPVTVTVTGGEAFASRLAPETADAFSVTVPGVVFAGTGMTMVVSSDALGVASLIVSPNGTGRPVARSDTLRIRSMRSSATRRTVI